MKSLNTKLVLSVLGIAMLATPAFAQRPHHQQVQQQMQYQAAPGNVTSGYPNPVQKTGSEWSRESGAAFDLGS
jgi:hypothetical protein